MAVVLRLFAQCALAQRFFVLPALHADARLLLLLAGQFSLLTRLLALQALLAVLLLALLVKACALFGVQRAAVFQRRRGRLRRQGPLAPYVVRPAGTHVAARLVRSPIDPVVNRVLAVVALWVVTSVITPALTGLHGLALHHRSHGHGGGR